MLEVIDTKGRLSVVATPIGNLADITYRAVQTLAACDYILCEDTRVTGKLLAHYEIATPMRRYDAHTSEQVHEQTLGELQGGKHVALVSDAGTPGISDPGVRLVAQVRESDVAIIESIPGPSAVTAAIAIAGLSGNQFTFLGYIPQKKGRQTFVQTLDQYGHPVVFFESTHRIMKLLASLQEQLPAATIILGRELTKLHEELLVGTPVELIEILTTAPVRQKGEFVVIFAN